MSSEKILSADSYNVTRKETALFSGHYLRKRSTLDIGVLGYIGILYHKEYPPEVWHIPPGTPCIIIMSEIIVFISNLFICSLLHLVENRMKRRY
jgi:hypothetical protein